MRTCGQKAWALISISLLAALACESPTPVAPAESGLTVSANPTRISVDGEAEITVIARQSDGSAVNEGTEINFSTTLGTISPTIAPTNDRGLAKSTLRGDGRVGTATIEVSSGAATPVPIDVQIGALPATITLQANPPLISSTGGSTTLVASVADDLGNPLEDVAVRFGTEAGSLATVGTVRTNRDGDASNELTLTEFDVNGVDDSFFVVDAETIGVDGMPLSVESEVDIGGFVSSITLTASPGTVSLSGGEFLLTAVVQDDGGELVEGAGVIFSTDVGSLASQGRQQMTDSEGAAIDSLIVSAIDLDAFIGSVINVRAQTTGVADEELVDTDQILISRSIGILTLTASQLTITSDVTSTITFTATVFDDTGAPVAGAGVTFFQTSTCLINPTCSAGDLSSPGLVVTNASGQALNSLTITAAQIADPGTGSQDVSTVSVTAETILLGQSLSDTVTVTVVPP